MRPAAPHGSGPLRARHRRVSPSSVEIVFSWVACQPASLLPDEVGADESIQIAVDYPVHITDRKLRAMVLDQPVRCKDVAANLRSEIDVHLGVFQLALHHTLLLQL